MPSRPGRAELGGERRDWRNPLRIGPGDISAVSTRDFSPANMIDLTKHRNKMTKDHKKILAIYHLIIVKISTL
jgi:hypothetical protein